MILIHFRFLIWTRFASVLLVYLIRVELSSSYYTMISFDPKYNDSQFTVWCIIEKYNLARGRLRSYSSLERIKCILQVCKHMCSFLVVIFSNSILVLNANRIICRRFISPQRRYFYMLYPKESAGYWFSSGVPYVRKRF